MVELTSKEMKYLDRTSSKGNQLKWKQGDVWYKADYAGYEGLAEYLVSHLLQLSDMDDDEYILYKPVQIKYKNREFCGACSNDFIENDWQIITLERLFLQIHGMSFYESIWKIRDVEERLRYMVDQVEQITSIKDFGKYISKLMTIDAVFLNEDRHLHNVAVLMNGQGEYKLCPIFDNGACLLSDTTIDYPLDIDVFNLLGEVHSKTISRDFDEQLDVAEKLYGENLKFRFTKSDVKKLLEKQELYSKEICDRVETIIYQSMRKYPYLFEM